MQKYCSYNLYSIQFIISQLDDKVESVKKLFEDQCEKKKKRFTLFKHLSEAIINPEKSTLSLLEDLTKLKTGCLNLTGN